VLQARANRAGQVETPALYRRRGVARGSKLVTRVWRPLGRGTFRAWLRLGSVRARPRPCHGELALVLPPEETDDEEDHRDERELPEGQPTADGAERRNRETDLRRGAVASRLGPRPRRRLVTRSSHRRCILRELGAGLALRPADVRAVLNRRVVHA